MTTSGSYHHSSGPTTNLILYDDGSTLLLYFGSAGGAASSIYSTTTSLGNLTTGECAPAEVHDGEAERGGTVEQRFSMWTSGASGPRDCCALPLECDFSLSRPLVPLQSDASNLLHKAFYFYRWE